jgi:tRNA dimethylallyltransferase
MYKSKKLLVIVGPTASGKTNLAINKALEYQTEIISADSRQVYKELKIGVARPSDEEMSQVKHYLIAHTSIHTPYDVCDFEKDANTAITQVFEKSDTAILVGGTGLYVNAVLYGLDNMPTVAANIVTDLNQLWDNNSETILEELFTKDPVYYNVVDKNNSRRVIRALSVIRQTNLPFSSFRSGQKNEKSYSIEIIKLQPDREELYHRINARVETMVKNGLEEEAYNLKENRHLKALDTVGYQEWWPYFEGKISKSEVIDKIKQHSRNYAKRQVTWWRKY